MKYSIQAKCNIFIWNNYKTLLKWNQITFKLNQKCTTDEEYDFFQGGDWLPFLNGNRISLPGPKCKKKTFAYGVTQLDFVY